MSNASKVTCVKCGRETEIFATVEEKTYCPACVPMDFIKERRANRKDSYNGQRVQSLEGRLEKAVKTVAFYGDRLEKNTRQREKIVEYLEKANDRVQGLNEKIEATRALAAAAGKEPKSGSYSYPGDLPQEI